MRDGPVEYLILLVYTNVWTYPLELQSIFKRVRPSLKYWCRLVLFHKDPNVSKFHRCYTYYCFSKRVRKTCDSAAYTKYKHLYIPEQHVILHSRMFCFENDLIMVWGRYSVVYFSLKFGIFKLQYHSHTLLCGSLWISWYHYTCQTLVTLSF